MSIFDTGRAACTARLRPARRARPGDEIVGVGRSRTGRAMTLSAPKMGCGALPAALRVAPSIGGPQVDAISSARPLQPAPYALT
jgi:hypothetical protein